MRRMRFLAQTKGRREKERERKRRERSKGKEKGKGNWNWSFGRYGKNRKRPSQPVKVQPLTIGFLDICHVGSDLFNCSADEASEGKTSRSAFPVFASSAVFFLEYKLLSRSGQRQNLDWLAIRNKKRKNKGLSKDHGRWGYMHRHRQSYLVNSSAHMMIIHYNSLQAEERLASRKRADKIDNVTLKDKHRPFFFWNLRFALLILSEIEAKNFFFFCCCRCFENERPVARWRGEWMGKRWRKAITRTGCPPVKLDNFRRPTWTKWYLQTPGRRLPARLTLVC